MSQGICRSESNSLSFTIIIKLVCMFTRSIKSHQNGATDKIIELKKNKQTSKQAHKQKMQLTLRLVSGQSSISCCRW